MISDNVFDFKITNPYGKENMYNKYLWHMEDSYKILKMINDKEIPYFCDAYSMLANSMERLYKGILIELKKINPNDEIDISDIDIGHKFSKYVRMVNKYIPISKSKEGYYTIIENCDRIYKGYTEAKYRNIYELNDFQRDFGRFDRQRKRLFSALEQELIKYNSKEVMEISEEEQDDLSLWE